MLHRNPSQAAEILAHLRAGKSISSLEALDLFGCYRMGARIAELRAAGHDIVTTIEKRQGKKWARYRLAKEA